MISFEEARARVLEQAAPSRRCSIGAAESIGRVLSEPLIAQLDSPPFDSSSVDGFAVRRQDIAEAKSNRPVNLPLRAPIPAGVADPGVLKPGQAARIFTGAPLPLDADAVVMQEDCKWSGNSVEISRAAAEGEFVRRRGEDYRAGDTLAEAGDVVTPGLVGLMAANGIHDCMSYSSPRVWVFCTGDELVWPSIDAKLAPGQINNSNGPALAAAVDALGMDGRFTMERDDSHAIRTALSQIWRDTDVLIVCGGMSVGDHDLMRSVFKQFALVEHVAGVAMKPGKWFYFGARGKTLVFGLPGNPVSALVCFQLFVRPALLKMLGFGEQALQLLEMPLASELENRDDRTEFVRAVMRNGKATPLSERGSHMLSGLAHADCLICIPPNSDSIPAGGRVQVYPLKWAP